MHDARDEPGHGAPESAGRAQLVRASKAAVTAGVALTVLSSGLFVCPFALVAHTPCPACGLTRASLALLRLDLAGAARLHPLVFVVVPMLAVWGLTTARRYVLSGDTAPPPRASRWLAWALGGLFVFLVAVWIARFFGAFGGPAPVG